MPIRKSRNKQDIFLGFQCFIAVPSLAACPGPNAVPIRTDAISQVDWLKFVDPCRALQ
jgi:hypothetical protein